MPPRTIDNLGVDISTRWAQDQELLDLSIIKESGAIPTQTQIDVTLPGFASEFDLLFGAMRRQITWADFFAPAGYHEQKKRLFSFQIIPLLGSEERKEAQIERIKIRGRQGKEEEKEEEGRKRRTFEWEKAKEEEDEEREKNILLKLLNSLHELDRFLIDINSRRTQYQKG